MKMKAAFAVWNNRIAPVFDVAREIRLVETESGRIVRERDEKLLRIRVMKRTPPDCTRRKYAGLRSHFPVHVVPDYGL